MEKQSDPRSYGLHRAYTEGNLLIVEFVGLLELPDFQKIRELADQLSVRYGGLYMLAHVARAQGMTADVRRAVFNWIKSGKVRALLNIDANQSIQGLVGLIANGVRLVLGLTTPILFVGTEARARAWVAEHAAKGHSADRP